MSTSVTGKPADLLEALAVRASLPNDDERDARLHACADVGPLRAHIGYKVTP